MKKIVLLLILVLAGCATAITADPWVGASADKLRTTWGEPLKIEDDGTGGQILTYELGYFYIDSSGTIYRTETNYNQPPAVDKWVGKSVKELIAEKGEPKRTYDFGGEHILVYESYSRGLGSNTTPLTTAPKMNTYRINGRTVTVFTPQTQPKSQPKSQPSAMGKVITHETKFYVDSTGVIYKAE